MADTRTYSCTDEKLAALAALLAENGVTVDLTVAGEAKAQGWDISWTFPTPSTVAVTVNQHPGWKIEELGLWGKLEGIFGGS